MKASEHKYMIPQINSAYSALTPAEKKIADYVLENAREVIYLSVSELAEKTGVGDSTIIRFCRSIGLKGYQEFKLMLAQELVVPVKNINENIQTDDELKTIVEKITNANEQAINQTSKFIDLEMLQQAIDIISQAQKVEVYGVGASGIAAMDFKHKFMRIGINVDCFTDPHLQAMSASTLGEDDVVVGISHSGSTKDTVDSCKTAREAGATVICITSHNRSPITKIADIKLLTAPKELPLSGGNLRSKIAQLHLLDLLSTGVALQNYEKTLEYNRKTAKSVLDKLY